MNIFQIIIAVSWIVEMVLGTVIGLSNQGRAANRAFAWLSIVLSAWLGCLWFGASASSDASAAFWIRWSNISALFIPMALDIMRHGIVSGRSLIRGAERRLLCWSVPTALVAGMCTTGFFLRGATLPIGVGTVALPDYGPGFAIYLAYYVCAICVFFYRLIRDLRLARGLPQVELQFMVGAFIAVFVGVLIVISASLSGYAEWGRMLPGSVIIMDGFIAYGIATRRIMAVSYVLQRMASYVILCAVMVGVYAGCSVSLHWLAGTFGFGPGGEKFAETATILIVVFSVLPARGWVNRIAAHLFIGSAHVRVEQAREKAINLLQMVSRVDELLAQLANVIQTDWRSGDVRFFLHDETSNSFVCQYPPPTDEGQSQVLPVDHPLVLRMAETREAIVLDLLRRRPDADGDASTITLMEQMSVGLAIGIYSQHGLQGLMLLGPRRSGRIYDAMEQRALVLIARQLGVALENAKLYTALQDGKLYNDLIVNSLASGLIAVDGAGAVTVMNRQALEMTGLDEEDVSGLSLDDLPSPLAETLRMTLRGGRKIADRDLSIPREGDGELPLRVTSSLFLGSDGDVRGALMLMSDLTDLRKLEEQVRRTDRLSSLGTLSAGMAHEIKNPLVAIKTFTQLLPERYTDSDFRDTFFNLISHEVQRIDSIVNRLLGFARPATPSLVVTHLHRVIEESLHLVGQQAKSRSISIVRELQAVPDTVKGDAGLLKQAFVNFFLNAIEAMEAGGQLSVRTQERGAPERLVSHRPSDLARLVVRIEDTGCGIGPEGLKHIFDPFFTTKPSGTGLGLSVAHGILQEHQVAVDVESTLDDGTVFTLTFEIVRESETEVVGT